MEKKLICLLFAAIVLLPTTLLAGPKGDMDIWDIFNGRDMFSCKPAQQESETPITAPLTTTFSTPQPPDNTSNLVAWGPFKLFDNFYYIGTTGVGAFVINTSAGLIVIDAGWGGNDSSIMMDQIQQLGFKPRDVKLILLSHEHIDHYGSVKAWKETYCPHAKVALSQLGWNYLRARPAEAAFQNPRPEEIDMYLTDGQRIHLGNTTIEVVFTPGHSPGCVSFIIPVRDHGKKHVIGLMGGSAVQGTWTEAFLYHQSVEYFQQKCTEAKCDVGLAFHAGKYKADFEKLQTRKPGEPNPLVIGTDKFVSVYLQGWKNSALAKMNTIPKDLPRQ
jgi:metallo-beta-lactamase class B